MLARKILCATALFTLWQSAHATAVDEHEFVSFEAFSGERVPSYDKKAVKDLLGADDATIDVSVDIHITIDDSGVLREKNRSELLFVKRKAFEESGNATISVNEYNEHVLISRAFVEQADGKIVVVDPATIQVVADTSDGVFSSYYDIVIPWPGLEEGAIAVLEFTRSQTPAQKIIPWSRVYYPQILRPRLNFSIRGEWSEGFSLDIANANEVLACETSARKFACIGQQIATYPLVDPDMNYYDKLPQLIIAESGTWEEMIRITDDFVSQALSSDESISAMAKKLTKGKRTQADKLAALHAFVSGDVRYVGLEHGERSLIPHPTATTLERRYGDCKDKTALYIDMAAALGIKLQPVLVSTYRSDPTRLQLPGLGYFDHMIACNQSGDECVDLTDPYSGFAQLSSNVQATVALPLKNATGPTTLPADDYRWQLKIVSENTIDRDGTFVETQTRNYNRAWASFMRASISGLNQREREDFLVNQYRGAISDELTPSATVSGLEAINEPIRVVTQIEFPNILDLSESSYYMENSNWMIELLGFFDSENKHQDYDFPGLQYEGEYVFKLPKNLAVDWQGAQLDFNSEYGSLSQRYAVKGRVVTVTTNTTIGKRVIPISEVPRFNDFLKTLRTHSNIEFGYRIK